MRILLSIYFWSAWLVVYILMLPPMFVLWLIVLPFDKHRKVANSMFMFTGRSFLWFNPFWKIEFHGMENYKKGESRIFIGNHQSFVDMAVLAALPWNMKWISKDGLFKIPILGQMMRMSGHVSVKRGTAAALRSLQDMKPYINAGIPVMLFPEGTRSRSGELMKFKNGAFMLSEQTTVPVQPILLCGTRNIVPPDSFVAALSGKIVISIMKPVYAQNFSNTDEFRDTVYNSMKSELERLEKFSA